MPLLDWLGFILSGFSLSLQLWDREKQIEANREFISTQAKCIDKLNFSKNIHSFLHEFRYGTFDVYYENFGKQEVERNIDIWKNVSEAYNTKYKAPHYNFDVTLTEIKIIELTKITDYTSEQKKRYADFGLAEAIETIDKSFPNMIQNMNNLNNNIIEQDRFITKNHVPSGDINDNINKISKNAMFASDKSMKYLIELLRIFHLRYKSE